MTASNGLVSEGNPIDDWQYSNPARAGRNKVAAGEPYYNNGLGSHGLVAGFLKEGVFSQMVTGFEAGVTYRLTFHVNARTLQAQPNMKVRLDGIQLMDVLVTPVEGLQQHSQPFRSFMADVSPGAGSFLLEIEQDRSAFAGLLSDFVDIQPLP